ncbi:MAG: TonB-dependent receptor [Bacteroidales bacterium]|nr:TonB-dependent receptor [Bacteroidales bacterium]
MMMNKFFAALILSASIPAFIASASPAAPNPGLPDTLILQESVISTLKAGRNLDEVPAEAVIATSLDARKLSSLTVADILRKSPGVSKGGDGIWATSLRIRGLSDSRLVTLADGSRIEVASDLTTSLSMFDPNDIERIEIIKGAQSSIYGSGAIGGIINVITRDGHFAPTPYFSGNATASFSTANNAHSEYLSLCGGAQKWYLKVNGSFRQAGDVRTPLGILPNSGYNSADFGATAAFKPAVNHTLRLQLRKNHSWDVGTPGGAAFTPNATASYRTASRTLANLTYDISNPIPHLEVLKFKAFYQAILLDVAMDPNMPKPQTGAVPTLVAPYAGHRTLGGSVESRWNFAQCNNLTAGVEMWRRSITSDRKKYIDQYADGNLSARMIRAEIPLPDASYLSTGIYAQDEMRLPGDRFILTLGGRADLNFVRNGECHNVEYIQNVTTGTTVSTPPGKFTTFHASTRTDPSWGANAGLLFKARNNLDLTLNLSRSYRSPALEELFKFIDLSGNKIHFGNPELESEKGLGADIGARFHGDRLTVRANAFLSSIDDMIVERKVNSSPDSVNDTLRLCNAARGLLYGAEFSISCKMTEHLGAYACGAATIGKEIPASGNEASTPGWLPMIPPASLVAGITYDNSRILGADLGITAAAPRKEVADGERSTQGWWRLDLGLHSRIFSLGGCNLQLFGGIDNILDAAYTNFLSTNRGNIICEPGRNFYLRANLTF